MHTKEYNQPDRRFRGKAYRYITAADDVPTYEAAFSHQGDPACKIKLFSPDGRLTYYVYSADHRDDGEIILHGFCRSPLGPDGDEWGDIAISDLAATRSVQLRLPLERDLAFCPRPLSEMTHNE